MKFKLIAATVLMAASALPAIAQDEPAIPLVLTSTSAGMSSATFERDVTGLFVDTFSFMPASVGGNVAVSLMPLSGQINFFSALLNGEGFSFFPEDGQTNFAFSSNVSAADPLELTVFGYAGDASTLTDGSGRYGGTVTVNAVVAIPEPQTWALMLAGLGAVGALRFRSRRDAMPNDLRS